MPDIQTNDITIHYEECGSGDPLILVMGLGADNSKWEDHVAEYAKHFRCIMPDNRGAGLSDKPDGPYTTEMMARDTLSLMEELEIERAHVAGISMGSCIAQHMALAKPEAVRSLVLVSSWARSNPYLSALLDSFATVRSAVSGSDFTKVLQLWIFASGYFGENIGDMIQGQEDADSDPNPMPQHAFAAQCEACKSHDTLDHLHTITAPSLLTVGGADIFTPLALSKIIQERISHAELVTFPGCAHVHHWEDLEKFNTVTTDFMLNH